MAGYTKPLIYKNKEQTFIKDAKFKAGLLQNIHF